MVPTKRIVIERIEREDRWRRKVDSEKNKALVFFNYFRGHETKIKNRINSNFAVFYPSVQINRTMNSYKDILCYNEVGELQEIFSLPPEIRGKIQKYEDQHKGMVTMERIHGEIEKIRERLGAKGKTYTPRRVKK